MHLMSRGAPCGRADGHSGPHRSEGSVRWNRRVIRDINRERERDGRRAQNYAAQLIRGDQIRAYGAHHQGVAEILGPRPEGLTVSRVCPDDCPRGWWGYQYRGGGRVPYRLCIPEHYVYETQTENNARKGGEG